MRVLALLQYPEWLPEIRHPHHDGFLRLVQSGEIEQYLAVPYTRRELSPSYRDIWEKTIQKAKDIEAEIIYLQHFHNAHIEHTEFLIHGLQSLPSKPAIGVSSADPFSPDWRPPYFPECFKTASRLSDVTFLTAMGRCAQKVASWNGNTRIVLCPHGACQVTWNPPAEALPDPEFDVVFVGNRVGSRNPASHYFWTSRERSKYVEALARRYGKRFALYGGGWDGIGSWQGRINFDDQFSAYCNARVIFGGAPHNRENYYTSDRPFIAALSGRSLVDVKVPRVENILRDGEHWHLVESSAAAVKKTDALLENPPSLTESLTTAKYIAAHHAQARRTKFMYETLKIIKLHKPGKGGLPPPPFDFFLPEVDVAQELPYATYNWR